MLKQSVLLFIKSHMMCALQKACNGACYDYCYCARLFLVWKGIFELNLKRKMHECSEFLRSRWRLLGLSGTLLGDTTRVQI